MEIRVSEKRTQAIKEVIMRLGCLYANTMLERATMGCKKTQEVKSISFNDCEIKFAELMEIITQLDFILPSWKQLATEFGEGESNG